MIDPDAPDTVRLGDLRPGDRVHRPHHDEVVTGKVNRPRTPRARVYRTVEWVEGGSWSAEAGYLLRRADDPADWREVERLFDAFFAGRTVPRPPDFPVVVNPVTPDVLGFVRSGDDVVEVSTAPGIPGNVVFAKRGYGLTYRAVGPHGAAAWDDRSRYVESWAEVVEALA